MGYSISFNIRGIKYDINLTGRVSVIGGDSGVGKTMFANDLASESLCRGEFGRVIVFNFTHRFRVGSVFGKAI
jgi:type II secretory pathway predicted ATPase ExeA